MKNILVLGAGQIGAVIAQMLADTGDYTVTLADRSAAALQVFNPPSLRRQTLELDMADPAALAQAVAGRFAVFSAAPFSWSVRIAEAARAAGVHYLDLTEDVASTRRIRALAQDAPCAFVPQCGLAPGYVSIVAADLARGFSRLDSVQLRVGALPQHVTNALGYALTWSTEGVINEYIQPCEAIEDGRRVEVPALEGLEAILIDGVRYEAFNTSGGLGTLCETLHGRVRQLNYRSIRYPGHGAIMRTLLHDLRLRERPAVLKDILEQALSTTRQDRVLISVSVSGWRADGGRLEQRSHVRTIDGREDRSAIQLTTASSACAVLDLLAQGALPSQGFIRQEQVPLAAFLGNRFGSLYAQDDAEPPRDWPLAA